MKMLIKVGKLINRLILAFDNQQSVAVKTDAIDYDQILQQADMDISYEGKNQLVTEQGYAVTTEFSSRAEGGSILFIAVGSSAVKSLDTSYENVMIKQGEEYVSTVLEAETETQMVTESETVTGANKSRVSQAEQGKTGDQMEVNQAAEKGLLSISWEKGWISYS